MNRDQIDYILKNYQTHSVKEIAETLRLDPKEIRRELRKILSSGARPPEETIHEKRVFRLPPFWLNGILLLLLLTFTLLIYYRGLSHPFLNWDDPKYVTENRLIPYREFLWTWGKKGNWTLRILPKDERDPAARQRVLVDEGANVRP